jgi:dTDP-4-dehydrorhamnose reductase
MESKLALWGGHECTISRVGSRYRDQSRLSGHADRADDIARFAELGVRALRYPLLWERAAAGGLGFADAPLAEMRRLGIAPILGLVHHGSGPEWTSLVDDDFAAGLAAHAAMVAARYPWVRDWTPVNEPLTTARFSCLYGLWYPHLGDERACWLALLNQIDATRATMRAVRAVNPAARLIQTDDLGRAEAGPGMARQTAFENDRRWLTWDLLCGMVVPGYALWDRIAGHGLADRLTAIAEDPCPPDVIGLNHYVCSNRYLTNAFDQHPGIRPAADGEPCINLDAVRTSPGHADIGSLLAEAWARYGRTLAVTECHNGCTREEQLRWFHEVWQAAGDARSAGIDVEAVTAWSLLGAFDWNSLLTREAGHYEPGVFDVRSSPPRATALAGLLKDLSAGLAPRDAHLLTSPGWWRRPGRFLAGYGSAEVEAPPAGPPILITGRNGTLAQALARACARRGLAHVLMGRPELEIDSDDSIGRTLDTLAPWAVINCAGIVCIDTAETEPELCRLVNALAPERLARACARTGARFVQISSDQVFDGVADAPYSEGEPTNALNAYGRAKAEAEDRVHTALASALVVRTAAFFSPHDQWNFAMQTLGRLAAGQTVAAASDQRVSPTYVPDLVDAILDLLIDGEAGVWHLSNQGGMSWAAFARQLAAGAGLSPSSIVGVRGRRLGQRAPRPGDVRMTSRRALLLPPLANAIGRFTQATQPAHMKRGSASALPPS